MDRGPKPVSLLPWDVARNNSGEPLEPYDGNGWALSARDWDAVVYRVNNWDALCDEVERQKRHIEELVSLQVDDLAILEQRAEAAERLAVALDDACLSFTNDGLDAVEDACGEDWNDTLGAIRARLKEQG